ncbi:6-phosphogluconolactonase [Leeia aquatica]|uniref:6-phosphogluconolactonase n=1 Tax=Leeia aquatica TaxID=2725557 RepID=A0A847RWL2_9NEIS|nr:6-phosphogluconolactonase [Leeia aquatica]NLR75550.1 6-phosphogluconolactonase [Leeia aquatica]
MLQQHAFSDGQQLALALASELAATLRNALDVQQEVVLAVSGGKSPVPVFEALREVELDWSRVIVTLVDERWVSTSDPASNEALVRQHLLQGRAAVARFVPMFTGQSSARQAEPLLNATFAALPRPFAAVVLGMGDDGHTASLFPASPQLDAGLAADAPACLAQVGAAAPTERMSLTLPAILAARKVFLQFAGASKHAVFAEALRGADRRWPVSYVLAQSATPVEVFHAP